MLLNDGRAITPIPRTSVGIQPDPRAYMRMAQMLRDLISRGDLVSGTPVPSITRLCQEHGHARQTCAKALGLLENEGLVRRIPGLGYYVI